MSMIATKTIRRRRAALLGGVALGMLGAGSAAAQTGPAPGTLPVLNNAGGATVSTTGTAMSVDLNDANRAMDWNSFSVARDASVAFRTGDQSTAFTVLNRVTGSNLSEIYGVVTSQSNIAVWLSNPNGIVYGSSGAFSGGSLVLTTAALTAIPTGTQTLSDMPATGIRIAASEANGGVTGINVAGSLIVAAQQIDVTGSIAATGDVVLVAARSVDVPAALGSNVRIKINEGTTVAQGRVVIGAGGRVEGLGTVTLAGAAGNATEFLLGIEPSAGLSATVRGGRVVLAAGASSTEAPFNAVTVEPGAAAGTHRIAPTGTIAATGLVEIGSAGTIAGAAADTGTIEGSAIRIAAAGDVTLANAITAAGDLSIASNGGPLTLSGNLKATGGAVSLTGASAVGLGTAGATRSLAAGTGIVVRGGAGGIAAAGGYTIQSGFADGTSGIDLAIGGGGFALAGVTLRAGTEATAGAGFRGNLSLTSTAPGGVPLTLEAVDANLLSVTGALSEISIGRIGVNGDLTLVSEGRLALDSAVSRDGSIGLTAAGSVGGRGAGRTSLRAAADGRFIGVRAGGAASLGDLVAGTIGSGAALGATQLSVEASAIDFLNARAATGDVFLIATGAGAAGSVRGTAIDAPLGSVTLRAGGDIVGQAAPGAIAGGIRVARARAGSIDLMGAGNARLADLDTLGDLSVRAGGSITGLAAAGDLSAGAGISVRAGGNLTVGSIAAPAGRVALGFVDLGAAGGAVTVDAAAISAASIDTAGTVTLRAADALSIDALGFGVRPAAVTLRQSVAAIGGEDPGAVRWAADGVLSPGFGGAIFAAGGALLVDAGFDPAAVGAAGIAQVARARAASISIGGEGVSVASAIAGAGALDMTARSGGLYLGRGAATGDAILRKRGASGPVDADELRVAATLETGGAIGVTSDTDVRAASITGGGEVSIAAAGSVTGLKRSLLAADARLAAGYERADIAAGATTARVDVRAAGGTAQLGAVVAGAAGAVDARLNQLSVIGVGVDITRATAGNGNLVLSAGTGGLRLAEGTAGWGVGRYDAGTDRYDAGIVSAADAQIGTLTATGGDLSMRVAGVLTGMRAAGESVADIATGLTVGDAAVGNLALNGSGDVVLGAAASELVQIDAGASARIGSITAARRARINAGGSITGLGGAAATASSGANLIAVNGAVRLPVPAGTAGPVAAVLGDVRAGTTVSLAAGRLSARSIRAGTDATIGASGGLVVDRIAAASATVSASGVITADTATLTVDAAGRLAPGFGAANISATDPGATIALTAGRVVQVGSAMAGTGSTLMAGVAGGADQLSIDAGAISAQALGASNGSLRLTARAGDLYLGMPAAIDAAAPLRVAFARDRATLTKGGGDGRVTITGTIEGGTGGTAGSGSGDDGLVAISSSTDIGARRIVSMTGDVDLAAAGTIGGLTALDPTLGGPPPRFATAGEVRLGDLDVGGALSVAAGDIRIGAARSGRSISLDALGSVTGLGEAAAGPATGYHALAIVADRNVAVGGLTADTLDRAAIGAVAAGGDIRADADRLSIGSVDAGGSVFLSGNDLWLGRLTAGGALTVAGGSDFSTAPLLFAADRWDEGSERLASGFGAANLDVTAAGTATGSTGTITVRAGRAAQLGTVTAGAGTSAMLDADAAPRDQLNIDAAALSIAIGEARNGGLRLLAGNGGLYAGTLRAGTTVSVTKAGTPGTIAAGDELRIGTLTAGTAGATGTITLSSSSAARLGSIGTASGDIRIGSESAAGAVLVSGLLREMPATGTDGQILTGYDGANLSAGGAAGRIVVQTSDASKLGIVGAGDRLFVRAAELDVDRAVSRTGDMVLATTTGRLRLGVGEAGGSATLTAGEAPGALAAAEIVSLTAGGDLTLRAARGVGGWLAAGAAAGTAADGLRLGSVDAGAAVTIDASGNARLGEIGAVGALSVRAGGAVTGLGSAIASAADAITLLKAGGNVQVGGTAGASLAAAAIRTVEAGGSVGVTAGTIAVDRVTSGGLTSLSAGNALSAGSIGAGGTVSATTTRTGGGDVDNSVLSGGGVLAQDYGAAKLTARTGAAATGSIAVTAGSVAQLGTIIAGSTLADPLLATPQITVTAKAMRIDAATAFGGAIDLSASVGDLGIEAGRSGSWTRLRKTGGEGIAYLGTIVSGTQAAAGGIIPAGASGAIGFGGGTTLVDSSTAIRGTSIQAMTGDILLRAVDGVTGRAGASGTTADFAIGSITATNAALDSAGTMRIGEARIAGTLDLTAQGSITGLADEAAAGGSGGLMLAAARGVDVRGSGAAALATAALGTVIAGGPVRLEDGSVLTDSVRIAAGRITATTIDAATGAVALLAGSAIDIGSVVAGTLKGVTAGGNGAVDRFVSGVSDTAAGFDEERLVAGFGDARLLAGGALRVTSARGAVQLGRSTGADTAITAEAMTVRRRDGGAGPALASTGNAALTSRTGALYIESLTAAGDAVLIKGGGTDEMRIGTFGARTGMFDSTTSIRLGQAAVSGRREEMVPELRLRATGGAVTGLFATAIDGRLDDGHGRADLAATAAGGRIEVSASGIAQLGRVEATGTAATAVAPTAAPQIVVDAGSIDAATLRGADGSLGQAVSAGAGNIRLNATGVLRAGQVSAGGGVTATTLASVEFGEVTASTGDIAVNARGGSVSGLSNLPGVAAATDGRLLTGYGRAVLTAKGVDRTITVIAGSTQQSTSANRVQLGNVTAGSSGATNRLANQILLRGGAVEALAVTARNANAVIEARTGGARVTALTAGGGIEERLGDGSYAAGVRAPGTIEIGKATATTGDLRLISTGGDIAGLGFDPAASAATDGRMLGRYGRADLTATAADRRILVEASGTAQLGAVTAGSGAGTATTVQTDIRAGAIDVTTAAAANGGLSMAAGRGGLWLGTGSARGDVTIDKQGGTGKVWIGTGGIASTAGNVTIGSTTDLDTGGAIRAAGIVRVNNNGTNATQIGGTATESGADGFTLNDAEFNRLGGATVIVDARGNTMTIRSLSIGDNAGGTAANKSIKLLSTGAVNLTGPMKGAGSGRVLQIGGTDAELPVDDKLAIPTNLATSISATLDSGASIDWAGGRLALAAQRIAFGNQALRSAIGAGSAAVIARLVSDPSSALYRGNDQNRVYLTAGELSVTYRDYALFQNSGANASATSGAVLGSSATPNQLALRLTALGDTGLDGFALFGSVNGFIASAAALQPATVIDFAGGSPRVVRITLANSRINGCGIGVTSAGCLAGTPPPPALTLFDERQIQLFGTDSNPELQFEPLIGTNNEGLIGDLATGAAADQCIAGQETNCPAPEKSAPNQEVKP